ncbi:uncharacterized protein LOC113323275 isoform X1 [Papaver somniferum]|uniref:uncharacterized protein LOC113323275 isoform X1 n=1 Tax=Papaver somniferum TaxID=3469 RepID=UPI000E6F79AE|nr:uncharacterized protein LOC113323275 isoform X1 [Papaver somniferum]
METRIQVTFLQSVGIPCLHTCSSIMHMGLDLAYYCHDWYSMDNYRSSHVLIFSPYNGYSRWLYDPTYEYIIPPVWERNGGQRKKRKMIESQSVVWLTVRSSKCHEMGHTVRSCITPLVPRTTSTLYL